jgi:hypothetical protein
LSHRHYRPSDFVGYNNLTIGQFMGQVIADQFVPAAQLCAGSYASACRAAGISA